MAFKKGQSGNPGGKAPLTDKQRQAIEKVRLLTPWAVSNLADLATLPRTADGKVKRGKDGRIPDASTILAANLAILKAGSVLTDVDPLRIERAIEERINAMIADAERRFETTTVVPAQLPALDVTPHTGGDGEGGSGPKP